MALCTNHRLTKPAAVRRLKPGLCSKGAEAEGQAGEEPARVPTRHRGFMPPPKAARRGSKSPGCALPAKPHQLSRKTATDGMGRAWGRRWLEIQISLIRPVLLSAPGTLLALDSSRQLFLHFTLLCSAVPPRPPCVIYHIYPHSLCTKYGEHFLSSMTVKSAQVP